MEIFVTHLLKIKIFPKINKIVLLIFFFLKRGIYIFLIFFFSCKSMEEKKEYNLQNDSKMINVNLKRIGIEET